MRSRWLFIVAAAGALSAVIAAWFFASKHPPQPPAFTPASNPYGRGIFANGIIESMQDSGQNITLYPDVSGPVVAILVKEGQRVPKGTALISIDTSVQQQVVAQQKAQAEAARALLAELKAQPRPEALAVAKAQVDAAAATVHQLSESLAKQRASAALDPRSVSREALDTAANSVRVAEANLGVAQRQYELARAGAWTYDVQNQAHLAEALQKQYAASDALLQKFTIRAPVDGVVLAINAAVGSYVSPTGTYQAYTGSSAPIVVMGSGDRTLGVRVYVDEILVHRLPAPADIEAQMQVRGTDVKIPLTFARIQPYVSPKIELSDEREERVDLRVLPVLFTFQSPKGVNIYPGQMVDVYIGAHGQR